MKVFQFIFFVFASLLTTSSHAAVDIQHWTTKDGARVYFVENHDLPILDVSINFPAGSAYDKAATSGVAGVTRNMMAVGAAGMNEEEITNAFADIGAQFGGSFDNDKAGFSLRTLVSEQDKALSTFLKILHQPDFPKKVFKRVKKHSISNLKEAETQPASLASKAFRKAIYDNHPYSLSGRGEIDTVEKIQVNDLRQFYQTHYTAKSAVIALIGDMTKAQAEKVAESLSAGLPQGAAIPKTIPVKPLEKSSTQKIAHPASQAHILLGQPGLKRGDSDYFALYVGNYILGGGGFVSRLTEEVREKRGLVYSVYSYFMPMAEYGPFQVGLQTKKEQADDALELVNETVAKFVSKGVTEKELQAAKDNIIGGFPMRIDSNKKILGYLSMIGFYELPLTYLEDFNKQVGDITVEQVNDAFKRRVNVDQFATVIVGAK